MHVYFCITITAVKIQNGSITPKSSHLLCFVVILSPCPTPDSRCSVLHHGLSVEAIMYVESCNT